MRSPGHLVLAVLGAAVLARGAGAVPPTVRESLRAAAPGPILDAPGGRGDLELVRFDGRFIAALSDLSPEESLSVADWPVSPGERASVVLRRFDVYAPDARIVVIDGGREIEVPRSRTAFFMGIGLDGLGRFVVGLDPDRGELRGAFSQGETRFEIRPVADGSGFHQLAAREAFDADRPPLSWECGQEELPPEEGGLGTSRPPDGPEAPHAVAALAPATRVAVVAVDTDNELMNLKFGNNAANATTYIAALFAEMNVIYERDVNLRLLQGYTILRPSTTTDPYLLSGTGNADSAKLAEFRNYWNAQYAPVKRALAMMLSGKQASNNSASGIATLDVLCGTLGYSFNQVFKFAQQTATSDVGIVAHELGHNMASPHTHCYADPKPDACFAGESCYSGSTSCPPTDTYNGVSARGTLMSYCHVLSGCSKADVYHPDSLTRYLNGAIAAASSCVFAIGAAAPTITNVTPSTGVLAGGTSLTITGTGFASGATVAFVELPSNDVFGTPSSKPAASVTFNSSTSLTVTTPSATNTGAVDVVVMNPDFQTATRPSGFTYTTAPPAPTVTSITPAFGPAAGGTSVTITGTNFVATPTVTFGGTSATGVVRVSATLLTATTPAHAAGLVNVVVTNPDLQAGTLANGYFYAPVPTATRWFPLTPCRVIDTRLANGALGGPVLSANQTRTFDVTTSPATCGIPSDAVSLTGNVTVESAQQPGEIRAWPGDAPWTGTSALSFRAGLTRANNVHLKLASGGAGTINVTNASSGTVHLILDVNGYYR